MVLGLFDRWRMRALGRRLERVVRRASALSPAELRGLRSDGRALRQKLDGLVAIADRGISPVPTLALRTVEGVRAEGVWRPSFWSAPAAVVAATGEQKARLDAELRLYTDCPLKEWTARQLVPVGADAAPYGIALDVFEFAGSYLSLSLTLPDDLTRSIRSSHVLGIEALTMTEGDASLSARLNVVQGPDRAERVQQMRRTGNWSVAEFDLADLNISDRRMDRIWIDIFIGKPRMNRIEFTDLRMSWRRRAEV